MLLVSKTSVFILERLLGGSAFVGAKSRSRYKGAAPLFFQPLFAGKEKAIAQLKEQLDQALDNLQVRHC